MLGSAAAFLTEAKATATRIAVSNVRIAGAFRLLELTTSSPSARFHEAPRWGPGPSQVGHPSSLLGQQQGSTEPKTACNCSHLTNHKQSHIAAEKLLRSAPRGDAFDERCGASRGRFHGLPAGRLGSGRAGCERLRPATPRSRRCAQTTSRSKRGRTPPPSSSTRSRRSWGGARSAVESIAARRAGRRSAIAPLRASSSRSHATRYASPSRGSPSWSAPSTSSPATPIRSRSCSAQQSLEEALTGLDSLSRAAGENNRIIEQARSSRQRLAALDTRLAAREAELAQLAAAAAARARSLAARGRDARALRRGPAPPAGPQRRTDRLDRSSGAERGGADDGDRGHRAPVTTAVVAPAPPRRRRRSRRAAGRSPSAPPAMPCGAAPRPASRPAPASSPSTRR